MTQAEKTEAVIAEIQSGLNSSDMRARAKAEVRLEAHARDLARKLDAIMEIAPDGDLDFRDIRAIVEGE